MPLNNGGYKAISSKENPYGKIDELVYTQLTTDHPIDLCRYQVLNCYMGRCGLINSGGESKGQKDLAEAVHTAVINKRAGGTGLISGRKAFQKPFKEGAALLQAIQDVYLSKRLRSPDFRLHRKAPMAKPQIPKNVQARMTNSFCENEDCGQNSIHLCFDILWDLGLGYCTFPRRNQAARTQ